MAEQRPRFAAQTRIDPAGSRAEIERVVLRYGATALLSGYDRDRGFVASCMQGRHIRLSMAMPDREVEAFRLAPKGKPRTPEGQRAAWEQATRQRWRAMALYCHAKLEAVASGIVDFDAAFLAEMVLPDGGTLGERLVPRLAEIAGTGRLPPLLDGPGHA